MHSCGQQRFCWVRYRSMLSAVAAVNALTNTPCGELGGRTLYPCFAEEMTRGGGAAGGPEPSPAFTTNIDVPGLFLINDFVSAAEEEEILGGLCNLDGPWIQGISRRVQVRLLMWGLSLLLLPSNIHPPHVFFFSTTDSHSPTRLSTCASRARPRSRPLSTSSAVASSSSARSCWEGHSRSSHR